MIIWNGQKICGIIWHCRSIQGRATIGVSYFRTNFQIHTETALPTRPFSLPTSIITISNLFINLFGVDWPGRAMPLKRLLTTRSGE